MRSNQGLFNYKAAMLCVILCLSILIARCLGYSMIIVFPVSSFVYLLGGSGVREENCGVFARKHPSQSEMKLSLRPSLLAELQDHVSFLNILNKEWKLHSKQNLCFATITTGIYNCVFKQPYICCLLAGLKL